MSGMRNDPDSFVLIRFPTVRHNEQRIKEPKRACLCILLVLPLLHSGSKLGSCMAFASKSYHVRDGRFPLQLSRNFAFALIRWAAFRSAGAANSPMWSSTIMVEIIRTWPLFFLFLLSLLAMLHGKRFQAGELRLTKCLHTGRSQAVRRYKPKAFNVRFHNIIHRITTVINQ